VFALHTDFSRIFHPLRYQPSNYFRSIPTYVVTSLNVTDRQTDGQTTYCGSSNFTLVSKWCLFFVSCL